MITETIMAGVLYRNIGGYPDHIDVYLAGVWRQVEHIDNGQMVKGAWVSAGDYIYIGYRDEAENYLEVAFNRIDMVTIRYEESTPDDEPCFTLTDAPTRPAPHVALAQWRRRPRQSLYAAMTGLINDGLVVSVELPNGSVGYAPSADGRALMQEETINTFLDIVGLMVFGNTVRAADQAVQS